MIPREILKKIRQIEIRTHRIVRPKLILCLALGLYGVFLGCSTTAQSSAKLDKWEGFPILPPIVDADPSIRHSISVRVPTRLKVERTTDMLSVSVDTNSFESTNLTVGTNMITGLQSEWFVYPVGEARPANGRRGLSGLTFGVGTSFWHSKPDGIPQARKSYTVEMDFTAFETDVPPQHMWNPQGKNYKILWQRTLKQTVE